jgi:hypothetical protein
LFQLKEKHLNLKRKVKFRKKKRRKKPKKKSKRKAKKMQKKRMKINNLIKILKNLKVHQKKKV